MAVGKPISQSYVVTNTVIVLLLAGGDSVKGIHFPEETTRGFFPTVFFEVLLTLGKVGSEEPA
jgi:hypothetical protein